MLRLKLRKCPFPSYSPPPPPPPFVTGVNRNEVCAVVLPIAVQTDKGKQLQVRNWGGGGGASPVATAGWRLKVHARSG